jgi:DNA-directed RNA polymerase subunit E'/Rpb7
MGKRPRSSSGSVEERPQQKLRKRTKVPSSSRPPSESSPYTRVRLELTISILPAGLKDVTKSAHESVQRLLLKYSSGMKGIPLAFNNMKLLKDGQGMILNELPHIHYSLVCDALVFAPKVGDVLEGVVRESFHSHLSLVVLNYFNASISASQLRAKGFSYDAETERWQDSESSTLALDDKVSFQVHTIHESAGIISIEGVNPSSIKR